MHPCLGNWVAIGRVVVYYAQAAHILSAEIKCQHLKKHWTCVVWWSQGLLISRGRDMESCLSMSN